jgi:hypothetical protein
VIDTDSGMYHDMDYDPNTEITHFAYESADKYYLKYNTFSISDDAGTPKNVKYTGGGDDRILSVRCDVDHNGKMHIAYLVKYTFNYIQNTDGSWQRDISTTGGTGSVAIDSNNYPHILYYSNYQIIHRVKTSAGLSPAEHIDVEGYFTNPYDSKNLGFALDSNDKVHFSYLNYDNLKTIYNTNKNGRWQKESLPYLFTTSNLKMGVGDIVYIATALTYVSASYKYKQVQYMKGELIKSTNPSVLMYLLN